jgi:hypothetical protein
MPVHVVCHHGHLLLSQQRVLKRVAMHVVPALLAVGLLVAAVQAIQQLTRAVAGSSSGCTSIDESSASVTHDDASVTIVIAVTCTAGDTVERAVPQSPQFAQNAACRLTAGC